ncbi:RNA polymerase sigma factor [Primorskyibacter sp. 2E107]|uniref:RNA polymerase sigma factor n=1 Tax=Primorskyibacter sp. 2E107 TaxID=3403458 RepID=UPI003AF99742
MTRLRARAARLGHTGANGEDLVQEVLLRFLERREAGAQVDAPLPYMMTALRHASQHRHAQGRRQVPLEDLPERSVPDAEAACLLTEVSRAIDSLPEADRALLRRVLEGETRPCELAQHFGVPEGTIMSRLARARQRLRALLEAD